MWSSGKNSRTYLQTAFAPLPVIHLTMGTNWQTSICRSSRLEFSSYKLECDGLAMCLHAVPILLVGDPLLNNWPVFGNLLVSVLDYYACLSAAFTSLWTSSTTVNSKDERTTRYSLHQTSTEPLLLLLMLPISRDRNRHQTSARENKKSLRDATPINGILSEWERAAPNCTP